MRSEKTITVYVVLHNVDYPGPAADGTDTFRTRSKKAAENFAKGKRCYSGEASAQEMEVSLATARRWGLA
jgi:hypothetical protein